MPSSRPVVLLIALMGGVIGCRAPDRDTLGIAERIPLPHASFESVHVRSASEMWLGAPGEIVRVNAAGLEQSRVALSDPSTPRLVGFRENMLFFQAGATVVVIDAPGGEVVVERSEMAGALALDVRGRYLFRAADDGAVIAHLPTTLDPVWGWAGVGAAASALALSPEGDRVIEAIGGLAPLPPPELLVRDLQTGRILHRTSLIEPVRTLLAAPDGSVVALAAGRVPGGAVLRLTWSAGNLDPAWRRSLADLGVSPSASIALSPTGSRIAVLDATNGAGLLVLDVETGRTIGRLRGDSLAVGFDATDRVYLLERGELRRLE